MAAEPQWLTIARGEVGQHEIAGAKHNPRIQEYLRSVGLANNPDEIAWCGAFVGWCLHQCDSPIASPESPEGRNVGAWAAAWRNWGVACEPKPGAVVVILRKISGPDAATGSSSGAHVGFWVGAGAGFVRLLGGNQGDEVKESNFLLRSYTIVAVRWPAELPA